ncbi:dipeptide/oligopeptide/nickel ABC transporter permease/ATP-binding protein [Dermabacter hominis]|uniref:dipeptide/oligopeptide/nickel ABC transporter permease/ATP-binding protein n=1 Tax=Dermabacter hominis TaxID=36740 RepID=UPI00223B1D02|nr:dipeptide/oligopeptide/nickel ABC transporter permease/ATP-binding protein [Dermabacter hominis]MCT2024809.1 dipeptide/oligopeptide/nickel ABC transporter permease/ATP-binding protein [Dermabacter hominis]MCT2055158.1 dipeptide/oligopeptide/nickel ABC transporter permease/ATP-binding protein [Dermabacter hominis]MCT2083738.1 dipeptide/oligopeptide/nickel ABC transporter permease/ATP-binding protein [Dermabacter hominis]MCT2090824.1 dipeptide/oligopeptide/nickel ABC transporter permease/ATP-b
MRPNLDAKLQRSSGGTLKALRGLNPMNVIAAVFLAILILAAILAPVITTHDPLATGMPVQPPSGEHFFGTDQIGRDVFARVVYGARSSLIIGLSATALALLIAAVLGSFAATAHKWASEILMRCLDVVMSIPGIALAAVFVAAFGNSLPVLIMAIGFLYVPQLSRVVRANVLSQFGEDYVNASKVMGAGIPWILVKHVARNCLAPILVFATVLVADAIVLEASLSFINAGVQPPNPSWGNILAQGKQLLLSGYWWPTFFPGLMILITVLSLNILSEGMTDAFASPRVKTVVDVEADEKKAQTAPEASLNTLGLIDPAKARARLLESLNKLHIKERARNDRLIYEGDPEATPLLDVRDLRVSFPNAHGDVDIVDGVNFTIRPGETMGLVGESGSGKSVTSMAIMGLLPKTANVRGTATLEGKNLLEMNTRQLNEMRGREMAMIYQDALSSLNPSMLIKSQMAQLTKRGGTRSAEELLELVGLDPKRMLKSYPHELSGGQRQRVLIAMALTRDPKLVIADEPTTALDVTVQKQVVELLNHLREELGFAMLFVSHDLALVAQLAHKITVMYAGQVVEQGTTTEVLTDPRHEYTQGLLGSVLSIEAGAERLHQVQGTVPSPREFVAGDRFAPRSSTPEIGLAEKPRLWDIPGTTHRVASTVGLPESIVAARPERDAATSAHKGDQE